MRIYNGDMFSFNYECKIGDNLYEFKNEKLLIVIYNAMIKNECITKEIEISEPTTSINVVISSDEMKKLKPVQHVIEIKIIQDGEPITTLHEDLMILESWWK